MLTNSPLTQALRELEADKCAVCGNIKRPRQSFCFNCWKKLSHELQAGCYARFGDGYAENYQEAKSWLLEERRAQT